MIKYKKRRKYKYRLHSLNTYVTNIEIENDYDSDFLKMDTRGVLTIREGYSWDGPSGPTIDRITFMQASLVHDALYQLIREGIINQSDRNKADVILRDICLEDGMSRFAAFLVYKAVDLFGEKAAEPDLLSAP